MRAISAAVSIVANPEQVWASPPPRRRLVLRYPGIDVIDVTY
jgi:hypothetical protein